MRRYLVIANQTLAEAELTDAIRQRLEAGPSSVYVLVPNTSARDLVARVTRGAPIPTAGGSLTVDDEATAHAQHRLGAKVDGGLGNAEPLRAVSELLERQQFDEIILSTLPEPISRWLGMGLPHRLQRRFGLPVTTIITKRVS
jgi:GABA permease